MAVNRMGSILLLGLLSLSVAAAQETGKAAQDVSGTAWAGKDSTGRAYVFRFLADGTMSYTSPDGTFTNGTWKQTGDKVVWELNNRFVVYKGTLAGESLAGSAQDKNGKERTFTFKKRKEEAPAVPRPRPSLEGTAWHGTTKDGLPLILRFRPEGKLESVCEGKTLRDDVWKQEGNKVRFGVNGAFAEYEGEVKGDTLAGTAKNQRGESWSWKTSQGEPPPPPAPTVPAPTVPAPAETKPTAPAPMETKPEPTKPKEATMPSAPAPLPSAPMPVLPLPPATQPAMETKPAPAPTRPFLPLPPTASAPAPTRPRPAPTRPLFETKPAPPKPTLPAPAETKPEPLPARPNVQPLKPLLPPTEPPSAAKGLAGTTWLGKDSDGAAFVVRFLENGRGESQRGADVTRDVTWRQQGDRLELELNQGYSRYVGALLDRTRAEGKASNRRGQEWNWTLTKLPADNELAGTTWKGADSDKEEFSFRFLDDGQLEFVRTKGVIRKATWKVEGAKVRIEVNNRFSVYEGAIKGDLMEGTAANMKGNTWTWKVRRQK